MMKYGSDKLQLGYCNGLKGIACLGVAAGHYMGIYRYAVEKESFSPVFDYIIQNPFRVLLDESFWLLVFCVISGFVISGTAVPNVRIL